MHRSDNTKVAPTTTTTSTSTTTTTTLTITRSGLRHRQKYRKNSKQEKNGGVYFFCPSTGRPISFDSTAAGGINFVSLRKLRNLRGGMWRRPLCLLEYKSVCTADTMIGRQRERKAFRVSPRVRHRRFLEGNSWQKPYCTTTQTQMGTPRFLLCTSLRSEGFSRRGMKSVLFPKKVRNFFGAGLQDRGIKNRLVAVWRFEFRTHS